MMVSCNSLGMADPPREGRTKLSPPEEAQTKLLPPGEKAEEAFNYSHERERETGKVK